MFGRRTDYGFLLESLEERIVLTGTAFEGVTTSHVVHSYSTESQTIQLALGVEAGSSQGGTATNAAPTSTEKFELSTSNPGDYSVLLDAMFADAENDELTFQLTGGAASNLFEAIWIDSNGTLQFVLDETVTGVADVTVQATDPEGGTTTSTLKVDVTTLHPDPIIKQFLVYYDEGSELWVVSGSVTDADGDSSGYDVTLGGLGAGQQTTTDADGNFVTLLDLPEGTTGVISAQVTDPDGNTSGIVFFEIEEISV